MTMKPCSRPPVPPRLLAAALAGLTALGGLAPASDALAQQGSSLVAGAGAPALTPSDLPRSLAQAQAVGRVVRAGTAPGPACTVEQAWAPITLDRVGRTIGEGILPTPVDTLVALDQQEGTSHAATLAAWLDHRGSTSDAADALGIHPNTLRHRMGRIVEVLDANLDDVSGSNAIGGVRQKWDGTARARVGYAFDRYLAYGTGGAALSGAKASVDVLLLHFPERFHRGLSFRVGLLTRAVERGSAGIYQVDNAALGLSGKFFACYTFHRFGTPVGAHIREYLRRLRKQMTEKHGYAV